MLRVIIALAAAATFVACSADSSHQASQVAEAPTGDNDPSWFGLSPKKFDSMPDSARLDTMPWPGDYWATTRGGISYRWLQGDSGSHYTDFMYDIYSSAEVKELSDEEIATLSPAEKYDIWQNRTSLSRTSAVTGSQRQFMIDAAANNEAINGEDEIPGWTGICNGWSTAAIYEDQPQEAVTVENRRGQQITFYASDIKALMSQIYFDYQPYVNISRLGNMCQDSNAETDSEGRIEDEFCRDTNPASFHLALGGYLAKGKAFVFDVDSGDQVWNQPAYGYDVSYSDVYDYDADSYPHAARGTKSLVDVKATILYMVESHPREEGISESAMERYVSKKTYSYTLELDGRKRVIGGEWMAGSNRPDFLWTPDRKPSDRVLPSGYPMKYSKVKQLLEQSL